MRKKTRSKANLAKASFSKEQKAPLREHLRELKRRLIYVAVSVALLSGAAYAVERHLIAVLLRPSHGEHFVYTSPMGGINFLFSVCFFVGIALSLPVIVYNLLQFLRPLMGNTTTRFIYLCSVASGAVAICGILFGYFVGLPAALHFLLNQFQTNQVSALISIQSYFSFVTAYMVGAAIMFQLPLILIIINRIKPLTPSQMFKAERAVIVFAFISAFIMNPTPNVIDQLLVVVPIIIMYQMGIGLVWLINRRNHRVRYQSLFEQDATKQAERERQAAAANLFIDTAQSSAILRPFTPQLQLEPIPAEETPTADYPEQIDTSANTAAPQPSGPQRTYARQLVQPSRSNYRSLVQ